MLRRISTKLVVAVLTAVALPFLGFAWFVDSQMSQELSLKVALQTLEGVAENLAGQVNRMVKRINQDVRVWSGSEWVSWALAEDRDEWTFEDTLEHGRLGREPGDGQGGLIGVACGQFNREISQREVYDLILLVDKEGHLRLCNSRNAKGEPLSEELVRALYEEDYSEKPWFKGARDANPGEVQRVDWEEIREDWEEIKGFGTAGDEPDPAPGSGHMVGFAAGVAHYFSPGETAGVLYAVVNWQHLQELVSEPSIKEFFRGWVTDREPSPYAWIWGERSDGSDESGKVDKILAHKKPGLYGEFVSGEAVGLPDMVEDAEGKPEGLYEQYYFNDRWKNAAFKYTKSTEEGGFGWLVGVGIDNDDIYAKKVALHDILVRATAVVLLVIVLWTMVIARRTTGPIRALEVHTRRVASGDLEAELRIDTQDELGELARSFTRMQVDLREQRAQLVKAEKDAAWREMARQIAHDIKNPLTPIRLSLDLLERARRERSPDLDAIMDRTLELIRRQFNNLREIAQDFYEFTGGRKPEPERIDLQALIDEVLGLHLAWAQELGVSVECTGPGGSAWADRAKLRRVLVNLVSNALEASSKGGSLTLWISPVEGQMQLDLLDTGRGLTPEVRAHLFEPYFTTKSEGTGLGLAIAKRVLEEMDGSISLEPREDGPGTRARVRLPLPDSERDAAGEA